MKNKLRDIAQLQPGVYIKRTEQDTKHDAHFLGIGDFDQHQQYLKTATKVNAQKVKSKYILKPDDLLFSTRLRFKAFLLPNKEKTRYVASNSFAVIRPDTNKVLAEYLYWFLNHPETQTLLKHMAQGQNNVRYIGLKRLGEIEVELPVLAKQKQIAHINLLQKKERVLAEKLIHKKELYLQTQLLNHIRQ